AESTALVDPTGLHPGLARTTVLNAVTGFTNGTAGIAAAQYGSGYLLATGGNLGAAISNPVGHFSHAGPNIQSGLAEALKLAYNAVSWTDNVTHVNKGPRRTGSGGSTLAGSLERWSYPTLPPLGYAPWLQPLIVRNQVFNVI